MKICTDCKEPLADTAFSWRVKDKTRHSHCRECQSKVSDSWYAGNKKHHAENVRKNSKKYDERNQQFVCEYLSVHPCVDCDESDILVLEFDHQDDKTMAISEMLGCHVSLETIKREIAKCDVRCANCHRRKTTKQFGSFKLKYLSP